MSIARKLVVLLVLLAPAIAAGAAAGGEAAVEALEQPGAETPAQADTAAPDQAGFDNPEQTGTELGTLAEGCPGHELVGPAQPRPCTRRNTDAGGKSRAGLDQRPDAAARSASSPAELASGVLPNHQRGERVHPDVQALVPDPEVRDAMREFHRTGQATVIERSDSVVYPFGESQPEVTCSPLRACDIELEAGEAVTGVALGDAERWIASPLESGDVDEPTLHVIVKPKDYGLATNLVVATTRRTYHLSLVSPSEDDAEAGEAAYHRRVRFYYPQDLVQRWTSERELRRRQEERHEVATVTELSALSPERLNFHYTLNGGRRIAWTPTTVFDDGQHVYIQLPPAARSVDLPALLVEAPGGGMAISNYRVRGEWYVVDGLFRRAELVAGVGRKKQSVEILNNRPPAGGS